MQPEGYEAFLFSMLSQLTRQFPQHQFLFIFDGPYNEKLVFSENIQPIIAGPKTSNSLRLQYWLNYKVPAVLKKHQASVFLSPEGLCSLRTKVPQCMLISYTGFLQNEYTVNKTPNRLYSKNTAAYLIKAKTVASLSEQLKKTITNKYNIPEKKITVVPPVIDSVFKPLDWEEQETIREKFSGGRSYFLCSANRNLVNLLKAFTLFKKRQKSSMLLLIAGPADEQFNSELKLYKLRNEVRLLGDLSNTELAKITASAYAVVHAALYDDIALPALEAMQCQVPVISTNTASLPIVLGGAALYFNPGDFEEIAQKMMQVFKDEDGAKAMVRAGNELIQKYQPAEIAGLLMDCILKAAVS